MTAAREQMLKQRTDAETTKKAVKNIQSKVEKTTLGDLGVLADLKRKMEGNTAEESTASVETKEEVVEEKKATAKKKTEELTEMEDKEVIAKAEEAKAEDPLETPDSEEEKA